MGGVEERGDDGVGSIEGEERRGGGGRGGKGICVSVWPRLLLRVSEFIRKRRGKWKENRAYRVSILSIFDLDSFQSAMREMPIALSSTGEAHHFQFQRFSSTAHCIWRDNVRHSLRKKRFCEFVVGGKNTFFSFSLFFLSLSLSLSLSRSALEVSMYVYKYTFFSKKENKNNDDG